MRVLLILWTISFLAACSGRRTGGADRMASWEQEILETEEEFAEMAATEGIAEAFHAFAAEEAVLMRNNELIRGKSRILEFYAGWPGDTKDPLLSWKPDFVEVAASGDLGYTYGEYVYSYTDSSGQRVRQTGIFHTVWKRQPDGSWRFVWD